MRREYRAGEQAGGRCLAPARSLDVLVGALRGMQDGSWRAHPDSRLRGNDVMDCGNDVGALRGMTSGAGMTCACCGLGAQAARVPAPITSYPAALYVISRPHHVIPAATTSCPAPHHVIPAPDVIPRNAPTSFPQSITSFPRRRESGCAHRVAPRAHHHVIPA